MESRIELRRKDFKKTFEDPRRRREEQQVQIRKQNRDEKLAKKRHQAFQELGGPATASSVDILKLPLLVEGVNSSDPQQQFEACQQFRKLLSIERHSPIQEVIESGVIPRLVEFLKDSSRPELQFEAAWTLTNIASGTKVQTEVVIETGSVPIFVELLSSPKEEIREQAIWALGNIAGDCADFRDLAINCGGLEPLLVQLRYALQSGVKTTLLRNATWTLSNMCRGKPRPPLRLIGSAIPVIRELLFSTDTEVLTDACWALTYLSEGNNFESGDAINALIESGISQRVVDLLRHNSFGVVTPALRTVGNIVSGTEAQTQAMVMAGCVAGLRDLLHCARKIVRKEACWSLSNITAGTRDQISAVLAENVMPHLVDLVKTADYDVKREATWCFANAASGGTTQQIQYMVEAKIIPPLCEALGWKDEKLVGVALDALEAILKAGEELKANGTNPYIVLLEEAHGFNQLEALQYAPENSKVCQMALKIMTTYLAFDDDFELDENDHQSSNQMMVNHEGGGNATGFDFSR